MQHLGRLRRARAHRPAGARRHAGGRRRYAQAGDRPDQQLGKPGADAWSGRWHLQEARPGAGEYRYPRRRRNHSGGDLRLGRYRPGVGAAGAIRAFSKGAPVRILAPMFTGTGDLLLVCAADSKIKTLKDATPDTTIAYSTNGSSSNNIVVAFISELGAKAKPTATGGPPGTLTAVMSGQVDIGWAAPPFGLQEIKDGKIRIVAHGSDVPSLRGQTVRVVIVNANALKAKPDAIMRFMEGYRESVDWMYSDPKAVEMYSPEDPPAGRTAEGIDGEIPAEGSAADRPLRRS